MGTTLIGYDLATCAHGSEMNEHFYYKILMTERITHGHRSMTFSYGIDSSSRAITYHLTYAGTYDTHENCNDIDSSNSSYWSNWTSNQSIRFSFKLNQK